MQPYQYRFAISEDVEFQRSPLIRAAFLLAQRAHANHMRKKVPDVPYLCHPIMVYDLLRHRGITDDAMLAAALLHDTGEMSKRYQNNIGQLEDDLVRAMADDGEHGVVARTAAKDVAQMVAEMTNPDPHDRKENKQIMQMKRARGMSHRARIIKIADQTASLICHLMEPNADSISSHHSYLFARKAHGLVHEIARCGTPDESYELLSWRKLFDGIYDMNKLLLAAKTPQAQANVRSGYRKQLLKVMRYIDNSPANEEPIEPVVRSLRFDKRFAGGSDYEYYDGNLFGRPEFGGIYEVEFTEHGQVSGFTLWASPNDKVDHYRNRMQTALTDFLQLQGHDLSVEIEARPVRLKDGHTVMDGRHHQFTTPMDARQFAKLAERADVIGISDSMQIELCAQNLARDFWMPETGGATRVDLSRRGDAATR